MSPFLPGAWGFVDDRLGGKTTIMITQVALSTFTLLATLASDRLWLWIVAIGIGAFVGPN